MKIVSPQDGFRYLQDHFPDDIEEFWAVALNAQNEVIAARCLFRGTVDACFFHPRDVFRFACLNNASSVLVAHNHPSGSVEPSIEDLRLTKQLWQAAQWPRPCAR